MILYEFRRNKNVVDRDHIKKLRECAINGMSNYYVHLVKEQYEKNKDFYDESNLSEDS